MKKMMTVIAATVALSACATQSMESNASAADATQAIAAAKASAKKAAAVGYEWRDTGKIIKKAQADADKGDYNAAVKLANKAETQGELAVKQHAAQLNAGPRYN